MTVEEMEVTQDEIFENMKKLQETNQHQNWQSRLIANNSGTGYAKYFYNGELILENDESIKDLIQYDLMEYRIKLKRFPYWRKKSDKRYYWLDYDSNEIQRHFETNYGIDFSDDKILKMVMHEAYANSYHPIHSMIESKEWDGVKRVDDLLIKYLGADDTKYVRSVTRKTLVGAVARVYKPGCKFDTVLTIMGGQGLGKSEICKRLGGDYYNPSIGKLKDDEDKKKLQGSWICELEELEALKKSTTGEAKAFISTPIDYYRSSYGRLVEPHPRQCIFIGTTSDAEFLKDSTGNRRFLPVVVGQNNKTGDLFEDMTSEFVQQVWAEAKYYYDEGESLILDDKDSETALILQEAHTEADPYQGIVEEMIKKPIPSDYWYRSLDEKRWVMSEYVDTDYIKTYDDGKTIELPNSRPGAYEWRDKVSAHEIWHIALKNDRIPKRSELRQINETLRNSIYTTQEHDKLRFGDGIGRVKGFTVDLKPYHEELHENCCGSSGP